MPKHNRLFFGALSVALFVLSFTPWLISHDGAILDGLPLARDLLHALFGPAHYGLVDVAISGLAWVLPALAVAVFIQSLRAPPRRYGAALGAIVFTVFGLDYWLVHLLRPAQRAYLELTVSGQAVVGAALALLILAVVQRRRDDTHAIKETRGHRGAAVFDVQQNRWRPLGLLLHTLLSVAIVAIAAALWLDVYSPALATILITPIATLLLLTIVPWVLVVARAAARRAPFARIVITRSLLTVVAGGERGHYPRAQIGGIFIPSHTSRKTRRYYNHHRGAHKLTLPVTPSNNDSPANHGLSLFAESDACVAINLSDRSIELARYLTDEQAVELRRRVMIRLMD